MISFNSLSLSLRIDEEYDLFCLGIVPTWFMSEITIPLLAKIFWPIGYYYILQIFGVLTFISYMIVVILRR